MTSKSYLIYEDTDYARHIQEALHELHQLQQTLRLVTSPDELEALEREIRQHTDRLGSLLVGHHLQQALDSAAMQAEQEQLVRQWPQSLKHNDDLQLIATRSCPGHSADSGTRCIRSFPECHTRAFSPPGQRNRGSDSANGRVETAPNDRQRSA